MYECMYVYMHACMYVPRYDALESLARMPQLEDDPSLENALVASHGRQKLSEGKVGSML
jgi:hypothetical protein